MTQTLTRTGIIAPSSDGSDSFDPVTYIRNNANWAESLGAMYGQGLLSARPTAGKVGRFYRATDDATGVIYYDDGATWQTIGAGAATDAAANVGSLRTLGAGALQASAGNHTHAIGAITGAGGAASLNVGTASGTVAAGDDSRITGAAQKASNLSDLSSASSARTNLGLGGAATLSVGTSAGTVAAGDHTHSGYLSAQSAIKPSATSRLTSVVADDPDLIVALASTGTYRVTALMSVSAPTTTDFQVQWAFSGTAALKFRGGQGPYSGTTSVRVSGTSMVSFVTTTLSFAITYGTDGVEQAFIREELILVVTAVGTLSLQWARSGSSGSALLDAGSTVICEKIA